MFADRKEAALLLAKALEKYKGENVIVLGIPRGGAETAYYVAHFLNAELSLLIVRKLGHPRDPEYAFGAMAEAIPACSICCVSLEKGFIQNYTLCE